MDLILREARVVDPANGLNAVRDLGVENGKICAVTPSLSARAKREIPCGGRTVLPGVIDMHVHVTEALGGRNGYRMAAKTGVTTIVDFAGPIDDITGHLNALGCGMNVACLHSILPDEEGNSPGRKEISEICHRALDRGALGLKLLGGHFPLTPEATRAALEEANAHRVMVAFHAGTTRQRSDIFGMEEAVELASGLRVVLAHINAYCRGRRYHYLEELRDAFQMLRENPNLLADSHLASMNGTMGHCVRGKPHDVITATCLERFGYPATEEGLSDAILSGLARVQAVREGENILLEGQEAHAYWRAEGTRTAVSFPANLPSVGVACALERTAPGGGFLIPMTSTDGGGIPRNNLVGRLLCLYHMGYLSLEELVWKCSLNPARAFGFMEKGHLGVGADADLTILDAENRGAVQSFALGREVMKDGVVTGAGGHLLCTDRGTQFAQKEGLCHSAVCAAEGTLYQGLGVQAAEDTP